MAGEYKAKEVLDQMPEKLASMIRSGGLCIALTGQPMTGVVRRPDLSQHMADVYSDIDGMGKYVQGLTDGSMVPVIPQAGPDRVWGPGELFFRS